jgi:diguanylate cyclase (GGDEF)-like protein
MKGFRKYSNYLLSYVLDVLLILAVLFVMKYARDLVHLDTYGNVMEIATQYEEILTKQEELARKLLQSRGDAIVLQLYALDTVTSEDLRDAYLKELDGLEAIFVADTNGIAYFADGSTADISDREYFQRTLHGDTKTVDQILAFTDGQPRFVYGVPLYKNGTVIGTLHHAYTIAEVNTALYDSPFSSKGLMYIISREGDIVFHKEHEGCILASKKVNNTLELQDTSIKISILMKDMEKGEEQVIEEYVEGSKYYFAYNPLETNENWYIVIGIPEEAIAGNSNIVIDLFYIILFVVVFICAIGMYTFEKYKNIQQDKLYNIAFVDEVTGGNTYTKFIIDVERAMIDFEKGKYAILRFDIDNFHYINAYYGIASGDMVLRSVHDKIRSFLEPGECVARITGDNFVVLLMDYRSERVQRMLDSLLDGNDDIIFHVSAGLYVIQDPEESVSMMIDKGRAASRRVKYKMNKSFGVYSINEDLKTLRSEKLKNDVKKGFQNREFVPFYQPKHNIDTGEVVGAEALVRWRLQEDMFVSPAEFIPMCEETGLILELDMIILEQVLQFLQSRIEAGKPCIPVSVNISREDILEKKFFENLDRVVEQYGVPTEYIEIEITETAMLMNQDIILGFVQKLKERGFVVDMDDFGAGYSSLHMLKDLPIDVMKIDRDFITDTTNDARRDIIFETIVIMAHRLNVKVVVEGVETPNNINLMKKSGCRVAQGYFYAKPMDQQAFETYLEEHPMEMQTKES